VPRSVLERGVPSIFSWSDFPESSASDGTPVAMVVGELDIGDVASWVISRAGRPMIPGARCSSTALGGAVEDGLAPSRASTDDVLKCL